MKQEVKKEIFGIAAPKRAYDSKYHDKKCPFTGNLAVKKEFLQGKVIKKDTNKSATIEWFHQFYVPKYERFEVRRSRLRVHNPPCIDAKVGQMVLVARTRPLSKTKNHVIIQITHEEIQPAAVDVITGKAVSVAEEIGAEKNEHTKTQKTSAPKKSKVKSTGE